MTNAKSLSLRAHNNRTPWKSRLEYFRVLQYSCVSLNSHSLNSIRVPVSSVSYYVTLRVIGFRGLALVSLRLNIWATDVKNKQKNLCQSGSVPIFNMQF